jgi:hypothetical protein
MGRCWRLSHRKERIGGSATPACSGSGGQGLTVSAPKAAPRQGGAPGPSHSEGEVGCPCQAAVAEIGD